MEKIKQIDLENTRDIKDIIKEYNDSGVLGAGALARGIDILNEMFNTPCTVFLGLSGPMVPSGLRKIISDLIKEKKVDAIVTNGANIVHDMIESYGGSHYKGDFDSDDALLHEKGFGRIGNVLAGEKDFQVFEERVQELLIDIDADLRKNISVRELTAEIGRRLNDKRSFLYTAYENNVPVFSPGITDSMLGLQMWIFAQDNPLVLNVLKDMPTLSDMVFEASSTGGIFLGGGLPKHYIMGANLLREGLDLAVQITLDRPEGGGLSGARLEEGVSWGKVKGEGRKATIIGDATMIFPLMVWATR